MKKIFVIFFILCMILISCADESVDDGGEDICRIRFYNSSVTDNGVPFYFPYGIKFGTVIHNEELLYATYSKYYVIEPPVDTLYIKTVDGPDWSIAISADPLVSSMEGDWVVSINGDLTLGTATYFVHR